MTLMRKAYAAAVLGLVLAQPVLALDKPEYEVPQAEPLAVAPAQEPKVDSKAEPTAESNQAPHFRRCESRDMKGTYEMVGIAGKAYETFPGDPLCHPHQWLVFDEGNKVKHVHYKEDADAAKALEQLKAKMGDTTYSMDSRGVLTLQQPEGKVYQICMVSTQDDGQSKAGDMMLSSYQGHRLALIRIFRKSVNQ